MFVGYNFQRRNVGFLFGESRIKRNRKENSQMLDVPFLFALIFFSRRELYYILFLL